MKTYLILLSTVALGVSGCNVHDNKSSNNLAETGEYEQTLTSTDLEGTKTVEKISRDVKTDSSGNTKTVFESKVTEDPKGLMNKTTLSKTTGIVVEDGDKTTISREEESKKIN